MSGEQKGEDPCIFKRNRAELKSRANESECCLFKCADSGAEHPVSSVNNVQCPVPALISLILLSTQQPTISYVPCSQLLAPVFRSLSFYRASAADHGHLPALPCSVLLSSAGCTPVTSQTSTRMFQTKDV